MDVHMNRQTDRHMDNLKTSENQATTTNFWYICVSYRANFKSLDQECKFTEKLM